MADFSNPALASKAQNFYDDPQSFEALLREHHLEAPWGESGRAPVAEELAFEIFFTLLSKHSYLERIDWAAGEDEIIAAFDRLFANAGLARFRDAERSEAMHICSTDDKRGAAFPLLVPFLMKAAQSRGRQAVFFDMRQDANFPALLTPEAYSRWRYAKFGNGFPVIP